MNNRFANTHRQLNFCPPPYLQQNRVTNIYKNASPNIVIKHLSPPSARIIHPIEVCPKPSAEYLTHLVPQGQQMPNKHQQQMHKHQMHTGNQRIRNPIVQFFENKPNQINQIQIKSQQNPSQFQTNQNQVNRSKHSFSIMSDKRSCRSVSHHNINITIESSVAQPPPSIIISPSAKGQVQKINLPPRLVNSHSTNLLPVSRPTSLSHNIVNHHNHILPTPAIINNPPTIINHHHPILVQQQAMRNQATSKQAHQNTIASYQSHQSLNPNAQTFSNEIIKRDKISSMSTGEFIHRSNGKKQSITRQEYYNQNQYSEKDIKQSNISQRKKNGIIEYIKEEKFNMNSRRLINQIFQNQTNKALLQMCQVQTKSRSKLTSKKSQSRSINKRSR